MKTFDTATIRGVNRLASIHANVGVNRISEGTALWRKSINYINSCQFDDKNFKAFLLDLEKGFKIRLFTKDGLKTIWSHVYNTKACMISIYEMVEKEVKNQNNGFNNMEAVNTVPGNGPVTNTLKRKYRRNRREGRYSSTEAAKLMGISKSTLNKYYHSGKVYGKLNSYGHVRYSQATIDAFNAANPVKDQGSLDFRAEATVPESDKLELDMFNLKDFEDKTVKMVIDRINANHEGSATEKRFFTISCFVDNKFHGYLTNMEHVEPAASIVNVRVRHWEESEFNEFFSLEDGPIDGKCAALDKLIVTCEENKQFLEVVALEVVKKKHCFIYDLDEADNIELIEQEEDELLEKLDKTLSAKEICRLTRLIKTGGARHERKES